MNCYAIDGDTIACTRPGFATERIRLWGLDCPEGRDNAAAYEMRRLLHGNLVFISRVGQDRDGRTVAKVLIQRTSRAEFFTFDATCWMISRGLCKEWTHFSKGYYKRCAP